MSEVYRADTPGDGGDLHAPHVSPVTPAEDERSIMINRVSWGAVFAGVVVALVAHLILNMIGVGFGASTLSPNAGADENPSASGFSIGAGIWWTVSGILAAFAGGFTAGRLSGRPKETTAGWHGLTSWALTTLVVFYLLTWTVGGLVGGAYEGLANAARGAASTAGGAIQTAVQAAGADPFARIENAMRGAMGGNDPAALRDASIAAMRVALTGDQQQVADARRRAAELLAKAQNIPTEEAQGQVAQYEQQYRQGIDAATREATEAAEVATKAVSRGALSAALALLLGAVASWFGGRMGAIDPTITSAVAPAAGTFRQRTQT